MSRSVFLLMFLCLPAAAHLAAQESDGEPKRSVGLHETESEQSVEGSPDNPQLLEKLQPLIVREAVLREEVGPDHPKLRAVQRQIQAARTFFAGLRAAEESGAKHDDDQIVPQLVDKLYELVTQEALLKEEVGPDHPKMRVLQRQIEATRKIFDSASHSVTQDATEERVELAREDERHDEAERDQRQALRQESEQIQRHADELRRRLTSVENPDERREVTEQLVRLDQELQRLHSRAEPRDERRERGNDRERQRQRLNELSQHQAELSERLELLARQEGEDAQAAARPLREQLEDILHARRDLEQHLAEIHRDGQPRRAEHEQRDDHDHGAHEHGAHEHRGEQRHHDEHEHHVRDEEHRRHDHARAEVEEAVGRVRAMHEAAERLGSAGLHEMAEELHRRAEQLEHEIHGHQQRDRSDRRLDEIMGNVEQLRHEVRQMHEILEEVLNRLNADRNRR